MDKSGRRIPLIPNLHPRSPICACGHPPPPPNISVLTRSPAARIHTLTRLQSPSVLFPGITVKHGLPHGCLRTPRPPEPGLHGGRLNLVGRRVWAWSCGCTLGWWPGSQRPRTCPWPPGRLSGGSCGMVVDGRGIVGSILRTMPRQSTAIPQVPPVVPNYIILEKNFRDALDLIAWPCYTSSDRLYLVEQTDLVEQPGCADRT